MASAGVAPRVMGLGPVPAIRRLLAAHGLTLGQFEVVEINEAFAAQVLACTRTLGLPDDNGQVNRNARSRSMNRIQKKCNPVEGVGYGQVPTVTYQIGPRYRSVVFEIIATSAAANSRPRGNRASRTARA